MSPFSGWDALDKELSQNKPMVILTIRDAAGERREARDRYQYKRVQQSSLGFDLCQKKWLKSLKLKREADSSLEVELKLHTGTYTMTLSKVIDGVWTELSAPQEF